MKGAFRQLTLIKPAGRAGEEGQGRVLFLKVDFLNVSCAISPYTSLAGI